MVTDFLSVFRSNIDGVRARLKNIRAELQAAYSQREELRTVPLPAVEIVDILMELLDQRAFYYKRDLANAIHGLSHDFIVHGAKSPGAVQAGILQINIGAPINGVTLEQMFAYLARDQVRACLLASVSGLGLKHGTPRAQRAPALARIEARIKELKAKEAEIESEIEIFRKEIDG